MKKLAGLVGGALLLLSTAGMALATSDIYVSNWGSAEQLTTAVATGDTGHNSIGGLEWEDWGLNANITTGNALASALAQSTANEFKTSVIADCHCKGDITIENWGLASQETAAVASADTGHNYIGEWFGKDANIDTGNAAAQAVSQAWANIFDVSVVR